MCRSCASEHSLLFFSAVSSLQYSFIDSQHILSRASVRKTVADLGRSDQLGALVSTKRRSSIDTHKALPLIVKKPKCSASIPTSGTNLPDGTDVLEWVCTLIDLLFFHLNSIVHSRGAATDNGGLCLLAEYGSASEEDSLTSADVCDGGPCSNEEAEEAVTPDK